MLSETVRVLLDEARRRAAERRQAFCSCEQLLETLLLEKGCNGAVEPVTDYLESRSKLPFDPPEVEISRDLRAQVLPDAESRAVNEGRTEALPEHLLAAVLAPSSPVVGSLRKRVVESLDREVVGDGSVVPEPSGMPRIPGSAPEDQTFVTPLRPAADDGYLVDRPELLDRLMLTLMFSSPVLVGSQGSGRRSLVRLLARRLAGGQAPEELRACHLVVLDPTRLIAGTTYRGELEDRVQKTLKSLEQRDGQQVLVVEDLHLLVGSGEAGSGIDIASGLVPYLRNGKIRIVGCTTPELLRERLEKHPALVNCLTPVAVPAPAAEEAVRLLAELPRRLEERLGVEAPAEATVGLAVSLCREHLPHLALPGAAERLLHAAAATLTFETKMLSVDEKRASLPYWKTVGNPNTNGEDRPRLTERHVLHALSQQHRIPLEHLDTGVREKIRGLDNAFREQIFGQDHVLSVVRNTVKVALMNLSDPRRPRGRLFFIGPPGTGKTECAKLLARYLMGREEALLRFDMSEYHERSSISTLLGSDKGLVDSEKGGYLTEPVRQNPHRVILFDEIEKAHPSVFNIFLQILDNGEIHDKRGCLVSFRHAICIFTSNVGCDRDTDLFDWSRSRIVSRLGEFFRPEFLDRMEAFVPFRSLDASARKSIALLQLRRVREQLRRTHHVDLEWSTDVPALACEPPDGESGARHILRWIQSDVKSILVDALLGHGRQQAEMNKVTLILDDSGHLAAQIER